LVGRKCDVSRYPSCIPRPWHVIGFCLRRATVSCQFRCSTILNASQLVSYLAHRCACFRLLLKCSCIYFALTVMDILSGWFRRLLCSLRQQAHSLLLRLTLSALPLLRPPTAGPPVAELRQWCCGQAARRVGAKNQLSTQSQFRTSVKQVSQCSALMYSSSCSHCCGCLYLYILLFSMVL
jgi:hypothetical protein